MSVELRNVCDRPHDCVMGIPKPAGFTDWCHHRWMCDWGEIINGEVDPRRDITHLMVTTYDYVKRLLENGPLDWHRSGVHSATTACSDDSKVRLFVHLDYAGKHWTWELFDAHFADGKGPDDLLIGRWPD